MFKCLNTVNHYKSLVLVFNTQYSTGTAAWSPHYVKDKVLLEPTQMVYKITRIIPGLKNLKYVDRLSELNGLWKIERKVRADLIEVVKIVRGLSSIQQETLLYWTIKE